MKLLMTADAVGGVWTYALDLARGLRAHGVETVLAVNGPPPSKAPADVETIATGLPLDWLAGAPEQVEAAGRALADLAREVGADLVQLNSPAYAAGGRFGVPVVGVQHSCPATWWRAVRGGEPWPADFAWRFDLARRGLLACDAVVAPTRAFAAEVQAAYALQEPPVFVWNGRSPPLSPRPDPGLQPGGEPGPRTSRAPLVPGSRIGSAVRDDRDDVGSGVAADPPYIFTAGRLWDESKGMAVLDAAAAALEAPVLAAGPLASPGGAPAAFAHLRWDGVLDPDRLRARLAGAAVFVSPSLYEPFGLAVLEAAQAGTPLVLSDLPTFRELWDGAAMFVPPRDPAALAAALGSLLADRERRRALGAAARERARRYTVEAMAAGMAGVFQALRSAT